MKSARILIPFLALIFTAVCFGQGNRRGADPTTRAATEAMRDGRYTDAEKILTTAIHELEINDPRNPQVARYLNTLAGVLGWLGRADESTALVQRAYEIDLDAYGPTDMRLTQDLADQASFARRAGDPQKMERYMNQALEIVRANSANLNSQPNIGMAEGTYANLVNFYIGEHRWLEADSLLPDLTRLCGLIGEPYRAGYEPCGHLADVVTQIHDAEGRPPEVEHLPYNGNYPAELQALNDSAQRFEKDGLYPSAEDAYNRAIAAAGRIEADPHNLYNGLVVTETIFLGQLFEKEGFKDRAEQEYRSALQQQEKNASEAGRQFEAATLAPSHLVDLYRAEGRLTDAEAVLQQVLEIQVRSLGERHRIVVQTLITLAGLDEEEGKAHEAKYAEAALIYQRAVAIQETNLGPKHPQLLGLLEQYAEALEKSHDVAKAAAVRARIKQISSASQDGPK